MHVQPTALAMQILYDSRFLQMAHAAILSEGVHGKLFFQMSILDTAPER
jgi:hypothetical protein